MKQQQTNRLTDWQKSCHPGAILAAVVFAVSLNTRAHAALVDVEGPLSDQTVQEDAAAAPLLQIAKGGKGSAGSRSSRSSRSSGSIGSRGSRDRAGSQGRRGGKRDNGLKVRFRDQRAPSAGTGRKGASPRPGSSSAGKNRNAKNYESPRQKRWGTNLGHGPMVEKGKAAARTPEAGPSRGTPGPRQGGARSKSRSGGAGISHRNVGSGDPFRGKDKGKQPVRDAGYEAQTGTASPGQPKAGTSRSRSGGNRDAGGRGPTPGGSGQRSGSAPAGSRHVTFAPTQTVHGQGRSIANVPGNRATVGRPAEGGTVKLDWRSQEPRSDSTQSQSDSE
ncbi:MAG: hypothetical protein QNJ30_05040 [Kiloniellales bacterium]|nr:hypothetical protein [Kiloniellales bacterium]